MVDDVSVVVDSVSRRRLSSCTSGSATSGFAEAPIFGVRSGELMSVSLAVWDAMSAGMQDESCGDPCRVSGSSQTG